MRRALAIPLLLLAPLAARAGPERKPVLRLLPLAEGVRDVLNPKGDVAALKTTEQYLRAKKLGVDLLELEGDPVVLHGMKDGSLFYLFYKTFERAYGPRAWVVQRIKRTERNWTKLEAEPETKVTYQVEVFKLFGGALKRADQHHGGYGMKHYVKREIVKEYEIGFADVPGLAEGDAWPFKPSRLFEYVYPYGPERKVHHRVRFGDSLTWTLRVRLDATGDYRIFSPELGVDLPGESLEAACTMPEPIEAGEDLVLVRGVGLENTLTGDWFWDYEQRSGPVLSTRTLARGYTNTVLAAGLLVNRRADGSLNTLQTRPGFAGRTKAGIAVGSRRWEVLRAYGQPREALVDAAWWHYGDIGFWFDGCDRVGRIYVRRTKQR